MSNMNTDTLDVVQSIRKLVADRQKRPFYLSPALRVQPEPGNVLRLTDAVRVDEDAETSLFDDKLDADDLRDLVAEIVREELQGALGEKITRNVRKLIRRELNRALAMRTDL